MTWEPNCHNILLVVSMNALSRHSFGEMGTITEDSMTHESTTRRLILTGMSALVVGSTLSIIGVLMYPVAVAGGFIG